MPRSSGFASSASVAALALALLSACAGDDPAATCDRAVPAACAMPAPSYAGQVSDIVSTHCQPCHRPGGEEEKKPLTSYAQVSRLGIDILFQVSRCKMPPAGQPPLSAADVQALQMWLVCGAPAN